MTAAFRIIPLDYSPFAPLFDLDATALAQRGAVRVTADEDFGFPCRVSLDDAKAGDELLLLPFTHHAADSPYRASGPIFVRRGARLSTLAAGEVPPSVTRRLMSLRAYDAAGMMQSASVVDGQEVADTLTALFSDPRIDYVHLHHAKPGCYSCRAVRA